jgi:hypothetical protein
MSMEERFICALSDNEKKILDNFADKSGIKKSKLIRSFIGALEGIDPVKMEIVITDNKNLKILHIDKRNDMVVEPVSEVSLKYEPDGHGNIKKTRSGRW